MKCVDLMAFIAFSEFDGTVSRIPIHFTDEEYTQVLDMITRHGNQTDNGILQSELPGVHAHIMQQVNDRFTEMLRSTGGFFCDDEAALTAADKYHLGFYWPIAFDAASMRIYYNTYQFY